MTITIPCETIVRLSVLIKRDTNPEFQTMRLDNGCVIVTDRKFGAVERVEPHFTGVFHILMPETLIQQCHTEAQFGSTLTVTPNPMLQWTSATTTLGYNVAENLGYWGPHETYDKWYERMVTPCLTPASHANGAMVCNADDVSRIAQTSPSGSVVFESLIDSTRPTVLRDINSPDWVGFFYPRFNDGLYHPPATVPDWLRRGE